LAQAHQEEGEAATAARRDELMRYYGAVRRYLVGIVHDAAVAEELAQEFAVRFLRGDFKRADPERGRFRDFVKSALRHLARDHWKKKLLEPLPSTGAPQLAAPDLSHEQLDRAFLSGWREELLDRTWMSLRRTEQQTGQPYHTTLRYKAEHVGSGSADLGNYLRTSLGKSLTVEGVRQLLHRARGKFADLLLEEVSRSLHTGDPGKLVDELIELDLLDYCRSSLERWGWKA
jgi:RNA polymerase sigma-70 factor (ECF subfamily)